MDACTVVTWNVGGLDETRLDERTEAACLALFLRPEPAHVVMLQELVRRSWHAHWKHHLHHAGYTVVPADPVTDSAYFTALAVRRDHPVTRSGSALLPDTRMGRRLVWAEIDGWTFATAHLESGRDAVRERAAQLDAVVAHLLAGPGPGVFGGDTNLRVAEEPAIAGLGQVVDAWADAGKPSEHRATWFPPRPSEGERPHGGARFDRVLLHRARCTAFEVAPARVPAADGLVDASDHHPVWVRVGRESA